MENVEYAIAYKEVFPLIMNNKIWTGCRFNKRVNGKNSKRDRKKKNDFIWK